MKRAFAIVIMGVSGVGKSTVGRLLAHALGATFLEGDEFHLEANVRKMAAGRPLSDEDRRPWLDRLGAALGSPQPDGGAPIATIASCSALKRSYRDQLRAATGRPIFFICLDADRDELERRVASRTGHYMPASLVASQLEILELPQLDEDAMVLSSAGNPDDLVRTVLARLGAGGMGDEP